MKRFRFLKTRLGMSAERPLSLLLATAVLSIVFTGTGVAQSKTTQYHANGRSANTGFCTPDFTVCASAFANDVLNTGIGTSKTLLVGYGFLDNVNGIEYDGTGVVPNSVFSTTGQTAALNVNIDLLNNTCFSAGPCIPLSSGTITVAWKVNGVSSFSTVGTIKESGPGFSVTTAGSFSGQSATAQGAILGVNFQDFNGNLGHVDSATITITTQ